MTRRQTRSLLLPGRSEYVIEGQVSTAGLHGPAGGFAVGRATQERQGDPS